MLNLNMNSPKRDVRHRNGDGRKTLSVKPIHNLQSLACACRMVSYDMEVISLLQFSKEASLSLTSCL